MGENTSRIAHTAIGHELTHTEYHGLSTHDLGNLITGRGATKVVAASDSLNSGNADYTCDGIADDVEILAAIAALPSIGGDIYFLGGNYSILTKIAVTKDNVTFRCAPHSATIKLANSAEQNYIFGMNGRTNITFQGLTLDGNRDANTADCNIITAFGSSDGLRAVDCTFENCGAAVYTYSSQAIQVMDCTFDKVVAMYLSGGASENVKIIRNELLASKDSKDGIIFQPTAGHNADVSILDNKIGEVTNWPIWVRDASVLKIIGNYVWGSSEYWTDADSAGTGDQITVKESTNFIVAKNICYYGGDMGMTISLTCKRGIVRDNILYQNDASGIDILNSDDIVVEGNICLNNHMNYSSRELGAEISGIRLFTATYVSCVNNRCFDNQTPETQPYGIYEDTDADYNSIQGNDCRGNLTGGILVAGANTVARNNLGYITENSGVAENVTLDGSGIGAIAHGCDATPTFASVVCQSDNLNVRVSSIDATDINILVKDLDDAVVTADTHDFYWEAKVR